MGRICLMFQFKPFQSFTGSCQELIVVDRLEQVIQSIDFETVQCILIESRGKDDTGVLGKHPGQFQAVEVGHLYVQKQQVDVPEVNIVQCHDGTVVFAAEFQERCFADIAFHQFQCQRLIIYDYAFKSHFVVVCIVNIDL